MLKELRGMASSGLIGSTLQQPLSPNDKNEIFRHLWGFDNPHWHLGGTHSCGDSYFRYYKEQCTAISQDPHEILGISTHQHVFHLVRLLQKPEASKQFIKDNLTRMLPNQTSTDYHNRILKSINFVVRLWLMLDVGDYISGSFLGQTRLCWENESIRTLIDSNLMQPMNANPR
jgi:hypothetical protein